VRLAGFKRFVNGSHDGGNSRFVVASEHGSAVGGDFAVVGKDGLYSFAGFHRVDVRGKENGSFVFARFVGFYDNLYLLRFLFKLVGGQTFLHVLFEVAHIYALAQNLAVPTQCFDLVFDKIDHCRFRKRRTVYLNHSNKQVNRVLM